MKKLRGRLNSLILLTALLFTSQRALCEPQDFIILSPSILDSLNIKEIQISYIDSLSGDTIRYLLSLDSNEHTIFFQHFPQSDYDMPYTDIYSYSKKFGSLISYENKVGYQTYSFETYHFVEDEIKNMYLIYIDEWPVALHHAPDNIIPVDRVIGLNKEDESYSSNWDSYIFEVIGGEMSEVSWYRNWWGMTVDLNPIDGINSNVNLSETAYELIFISEDNEKLPLTEMINQLQNLGLDCDKRASILMIEFGLYHRFIATIK